MTRGPDREAELRRAAALGRYLVGEEPPRELLERYVDACGYLDAGEPAPEDAEILDFATRHSWLLGPIDAAAAVLQPDGALRRRLTIMAAVLEASPEGAAWFLPRAASGWGLAGMLLREAGTHVLRLLVGVPVLLALARARP